MNKELILKKIEQIKTLLHELESFLAKPFSEFKEDIRSVRASERNIQLIVELASEINANIILTQSGKTPDSYRQSFNNLEKFGIIKSDCVNQLINSAKLRNILIHEYDFDDDFEILYSSLKKITPAYHEYLTSIVDYLKKTK